MFNVNLILRIITPSEVESGELLVFLDDDGNIPKIEVERDLNIDSIISSKLNEWFYVNDLYTIESTKQISYIENKEETINIYYNFLSTSTTSKVGSYVIFNERNIELFRMINNKSI